MVGILFLVQNKTNSEHRASGGALIFSSIPLPLAYSYTEGKRG